MRNHSTYCCVCILGHLILSLSRTRGPPLPLHPRSRFSGDSETSNFRSLKYLRKRSFDVYLCDLGLLRDSSLLTDFCLICCYAFMVLFLPIFLIFSDGLLFILVFSIFLHFSQSKGHLAMDVFFCFVITYWFSIGCVFPNEAHFFCLISYCNFAFYGFFLFISLIFSYGFLGVVGTIFTIQQAPCCGFVLPDLSWLTNFPIICLFPNKEHFYCLKLLQLCFYGSFPLYFSSFQ